MDRESGRAYVDDEAEIVKARDEALREFGLVTTIEVGGTEVAIIGVVAKHVVRSGEHRGGYREDGFLGSPTALDAQELRAEVAVLLPRRGPRGLHQGGLEPRIARACAIGQTFTGALMQPGTEPGPRHEMSRAGEAGHIEADLGDDHARHGFTDAGHGDQVVDAGAKGREGPAQARLHLPPRRFRRFDLSEVQLEHEPWVGGDSSLQTA